MTLQIVSFAWRLLVGRCFGRISRPVFFGAVLGLVASNASAQAFATVGTRAQGMAGAFVAVADDASAIYWNPAGLATGPTFDMQWGLESSESIGDRARPLDPGERASRGGSRVVALAAPSLGLGYYRLHSLGAAAGALPTVTASGDRQNDRWGDSRLDVLTTQNYGISLLQSVSEGLVIGTTLRMVRGVAARGSLPGGGLPSDALDAADDLEGQKSTRFDLDAGAMASFGAVRVGVAARNLRQVEFALPQGLDAGGVRLERQVRLGVAVAPRSRPTGVHGPFTVSVDFDLSRNSSQSGDEQRQVAAGFERWWAGGRLGTRAGLRADTLGSDRRVAVAAGFSLAVRTSTFIEGQVTRGRETSDRGWGIDTRVTF